MLTDTLERQRARDAPRPATKAKALPERSVQREASEPTLRGHLRQALDRWADDGGYIAPAIDVSARRLASDRRREAMARAEEAEAARAKALRRSSMTTETIVVESPYGRTYTDDKGHEHNKRDVVQRVVDTIAHMFARRQIGQRQEFAARRVQEAYETAPASYRCALAPGEGGGAINACPSEAQLWAGQVLNQVRGLLGVTDTKVVMLVCGQGFTIEQAARVKFGVREGVRVSRQDHDEIARRLKGSLTLLADTWWPVKQRARFMRAAGAVPAGDPTQPAGKSGAKRIDVDVVAHISPRRPGVRR